MENLVQQYFDLIGGAKIYSILALIAVNIILGIWIAVKNKTFAWNKIANFMGTDVLMMFGGYLILGIVGMAEEVVKPIVIVALVAINTKLLADVLNKIKALGLPVIKS
jgi:hypothetical protein